MGLALQMFKVILKAKKIMLKLTGPNLIEERTLTFNGEIYTRINDFIANEIKFKTIFLKYASNQNTHAERHGLDITMRALQLHKLLLFSRDVFGVTLHDAVVVDLTTG